MGRPQNPAPFTPSGYGLSPELTARIADLENVCGLKIPRPLQHYAKVQKVCGDKIVTSQPSEAEAVAKQLQPLREVSEKWLRANWVQRKLIPIAYIKAWCEMMGMAGGPVRPGLPQITDRERQELRSELERTGLLARVPTAKAA